MNWTGGALSRSRNANAKVSLSVKQKNHFAKARVKLHNGQSSSPPKIQYFDFGEWRRENDDRRSKPEKQRVSSQRTLDQFQNVQGVVRKLKSLRPKNEGKKRKRSPINDTEGYVLPSGIAVPPISPTIVSSRRTASPTSDQAEPTVKRTSSPSIGDELDSLAFLDSVEDKRRKLLQENDWVGVERQRRISMPVKMKFTDAKDRDLIGRRRPLNSSAVQNAENVQSSRPVELPPIAFFSKKSRGLVRCHADEYWSTNNGLSTRVASQDMQQGLLSDKILDPCQSSRIVQRSSRVVNSFSSENARFTPNPRHRRREANTPFIFSDESSEPFCNLVSPEKVKQSGIAQLEEAANIAEDELQLPEDYHFPEHKPEFRLIFEQTPQPYDHIPAIQDRRSPIVRDFAFVKGQRPGAAIEYPADSEDRNMLEEMMFEYAPVEGAKSSTSPLSIATSRYMQELENQSFGSDGRRLFAQNMANPAANARTQSAANLEKAEEKRGMAGDRERHISVLPDEGPSEEPIQPTENEDRIWLNFINPDELDNLHQSQEQPLMTHKPRTTAKVSVDEKNIRRQALQKPGLDTAPPPPPDDELLWRKFIFSDSDPDDHEWVIEEASRSELPADNHVSAYNPTHTQPSMVAEAATSPIKQNPHLLDEMLDDATSDLDDDTSRYVNVSTSSAWSPGTARSASSTSQRRLSPSNLPPSRSSVPVTTLTAAYDSQGRSSDPPLPESSTRVSNPSSLIAEASSSSIPIHSVYYASPTNATHSSSSDELSWTPSRLHGFPTPKEKVVFKKPSRYVGEKASDPPAPVHLGRKRGTMSKDKKKQKGMSLAEAVERAKGKADGKGRKMGRDGGDGGQEARRRRRRRRTETTLSMTEYVKRPAGRVPKCSDLKRF